MYFYKPRTRLLTFLCASRVGVGTQLRPTRGGGMYVCCICMYAEELKWRDWYVCMRGIKVPRTYASKQGVGVGAGVGVGVGSGSGSESESCGSNARPTEGGTVRWGRSAGGEKRGRDETGFTASEGAGSAAAHTERRALQRRAVDFTTRRRLFIGRLELLVCIDTWRQIARRPTEAAHCGPASGGITSGA